MHFAAGAAHKLLKLIPKNTYRQVNRWKLVESAKE
jgi:hypothetical protein